MGIFGPKLKDLQAQFQLSPEDIWRVYQKNIKTFSNLDASTRRRFIASIKADKKSTADLLKEALHCRKSIQAIKNEHTVLLARLGANSSWPALFDVATNLNKITAEEWETLSKTAAEIDKLEQECERIRAACERDYKPGVFDVILAARKAHRKALKSNPSAELSEIIEDELTRIGYKESVVVVKLHAHIDRKEFVRYEKTKLQIRELRAAFSDCPVPINLLQNYLHVRQLLAFVEKENLRIEDFEEDFHSIETLMTEEASLLEEVATLRTKTDDLYQKAKAANNSAILSTSASAYSPEARQALQHANSAALNTSVREAKRGLEATTEKILGER